MAKSWLWMLPLAGAALVACDRSTREEIPAKDPQAAVARGSIRTTTVTTASPAVIDAVASLLGGREFIPSREQIERAGQPEEVAEALRVIVRDRGARLQHRVQAVSLLRFYPDNRTWDVYESVLGERAADPALTRTSVKALDEAFGLQGTPLLRRALEVDDVVTRETAVRILLASKAPEARSVLSEHLPRERDANLAKSLRSALDASP